MLHQFNGGQHIGISHVRPCQLDSLNGKHGLANLIKTGCLGILKGLPNDLIKI